VQLAPVDLAKRVVTILEAAQRFLAELPDDKLLSQLPMLEKRPRSYGALAAHIASIIEAFLDLMENDKPLRDNGLDGIVPPHIKSRTDLINFIGDVQARFERWWASHGSSADFDANADVHYGVQTRHDYFERSAWHAAQHTRQLQHALQLLGITLERPLTARDLSGLPLPKSVFDE
jgi:hypothetical protein